MGKRIGESMKLYFEKRVVLGFVVALAIIVWLGVLSFLNHQKFAETSEWVSHTHEVLFHSEQVLTAAMDIETSQRGYVITGDSLFLKPLMRDTGTLYHHLDTLQMLTRDNSAQQKRIEKLTMAVEKKATFAQNVAAVRQQGFKPALDSMQTFKGISLMNDIKTIVGDIQREEQRLLQERLRANGKNFNQYNRALIGLLSATILILLLVFIAIHVNLKARAVASAQLREASSEIKDLYENAPCGYHSVNADGVFVEMNHTMLSWLGYRKVDVIGKLRFLDILDTASQQTANETFPVFKAHGAVKNLELVFIRRNGTTFPALINSTAIRDARGTFIKSRSTVFDITERKVAEEKFIQLNQEMEAFTYSVSHDLRAPLRSIDGYAKILQEDNGHCLDAEANRLVDVITNNARRMGKLIDGLLDFSRIGRRDMIRARCDMNALVQSVIYELVKDNSSFIKTLTLHPCVADPSMIRHVWTNLLSNAIKFTATVAASIEIGSYTEGNYAVYYVKDNGVGFDMQYAHKLFGVFQRLHKANDFDGTGVGLAIAHRIITKHDGKMWTEAKVNEGATFFFSIPIAPNVVNNG